MSTILHTLKTYKWWVVISVTLVSAIIFGLSVSGSNNKIKSIKPTREQLDSKVEVSGTVEAAKTSDLSFERSGVIANINVKVGDRVRTGQTLASLSSGEAYAAVLEARGYLDAQRANLAQLEAGATEAERNLKQQALDNANADLKNANDQIADTVRNTSNSLRDIFDYKLGSFFRKEGGTYKMTFSTCDQSSQFELESLRSGFDVITVSDLDNAYSSTVSVNSFVTKMNDFLSRTCALSDNTLSDERATVSGVKTSISTIFSDIASKKSLVQTAKNAVTRAQRDLDLTLAGTDANKIASARAAVTQAEARLSSAQASAAKNLLVAPFNGVITAVNIEKGEISSVAKAGISMISDSAFQIKAKVSEVDISSIKMLASSTVTLDAYGPDVKFDAIVSSIDPAATVDSGSPRYGITLTFVQNDDRVKAGMTANADIVTASKDSALVLPASYVQIKSGGGIVKVVTATGTEDRIVKIGLRGSNGKVEILEGLTENDSVAEIAKDGTVVR